MHNLKDALAGTVGVGVAVLGVVLGEDILRVISGFLGCLIPPVVLWSIFSRVKRDQALAELEKIKNAQTICHVCKIDMEPPVNCPFPDDSLPVGCPKRKLKEKKG